MSSCQLWIRTRTLCEGRAARRPRRAARSSWRSDQAKDHTDTRLACADLLWWCVCWRILNCFWLLAARSPRAAENRKPVRMRIRNPLLSPLYTRCQAQLSPLWVCLLFAVCYLASSSLQSFLAFGIWRIWRIWHIDLLFTKNS
jgi:hypothetical protein